MAFLIIARVNELEEVSKPYFGGAKGDQFEAKCEQIEHMFASALSDITSVSNSILDVQAPSWYDDILGFRIIIKDIEVRYNSMLFTCNLHKYVERKLKYLFTKITQYGWMDVCYSIAAERVKS